MARQATLRPRYDVAILGGGPAGLASAIWCRDQSLHTVVIEAANRTGGQLRETYEPITNYPGITCTSATELSAALRHQIDDPCVTVSEGTPVTRVNLDAHRVSLADGAQIEASAIILATGLRRRSLDDALAHGADQSLSFVNGSGLVVSGARQRDVLVGQRVCIVGGGDAAVINAARLSEVAKSVLLIHRGADLTARADFRRSVRRAGNLQVHLNTVVRRVLVEGGRVAAVEYENTSSGESCTEEIDALLVRTGFKPNTDLVKGQIDLDHQGYVMVDHYCETRAHNVFAVGDIKNRGAPTLSSAMGDGATAVKAIAKRLRY